MFVMLFLSLNNKSLNLKKKKRRRIEYGLDRDVSKSDLIDHILNPIDGYTKY